MNFSQLNNASKSLLSFLSSSGKAFHAKVQPKRQKKKTVERKSKCHFMKSIKLSPLLMWKNTAVPFMKRKKAKKIPMFPQVQRVPVCPRSLGYAYHSGL